MECFRLRTLPVSMSGVIIAIGIAKWMGHFKWVPALLCLVFALLAQIVSNTANEYFDYLKGTDKPGRVGPRRGVTEGDIKPSTLRNVTLGLMALAGIVGCGLIPYGGWWLLPIGIVIGLAALAYSTGPYPLSYHGLGELTVFIFFGLVPVNLTYFVQALRWDGMPLTTATWTTTARRASARRWSSSAARQPPCPTSSTAMPACSSSPRCGWALPLGAICRGGRWPSPSSTWCSTPPPGTSCATATAPPLTPCWAKRPAICLFSPYC